VAEHSLSVRAVVVMLHYFMQSSLVSPEAAAKAGTIYLTMLQMPGSGTRQLQQPMVTRAIFGMVGEWTPTALGAKSSKKTATAAADSDGDDDDDFSLGAKRKAGSPVKAAIGGKAKRGAGSSTASLNGQASHPVMLELMRSFVAALVKFKLSIGADTQEEVISLLLEVSRKEWPGLKAAAAANWELDQSSPVGLAYQGLSALCLETSVAMGVAHQLVYSVVSNSTLSTLSTLSSPLNSTLSTLSVHA
jgi:hypothetical protein